LQFAQIFAKREREREKGREIDEERKIEG